MEQSQQTDEELVRAAQSHDALSVAALYDRHFKKLYAFIYRHVDHVQDAEDLTSDVMIRMVKNIGTFSQGSSFKTWLYGIARHAIADFWRGKYRLPETLVAEYAGIGRAEVASEDRATAESMAAADVVFDQERNRAERVFVRLSEQYRTVLQHRFFKQHTIEETAQAMSTTVGNVKVLQHRALKKAAQLAKEIQ